MANNPKEGQKVITTWTEKFDELMQLTLAAWTSNDENEVLKVQKVIVAVSKRASEVRQAFDNTFDMKEAFGADSFPKVTRIRAKSENVGRPKKAKEVDTTLDF